MKRNKGFILHIAIVIIALAALKIYTGFDIVEWAHTPTGQKIVVPVADFFKKVWDVVQGWIK